MPKTIAVVGSTGQQGGAVARACLKAGWNVRGLTRSTSSQAAQTLASEGAEMVTANIDDLDTLIQAFHGVEAVFCLTNFWEHLFKGLSAEDAGRVEAVQAFKVATAAARTSTLQHFLFSTLPSALALTNGERPVPHMDHKAAVDDRIRKELPELAAKTTFVWMGWYSANMAAMPLIRPFEVPQTGKYVWMQPSKADAVLPISGDVSTNLGVYAVAALQHPEKTRGKYIDVRSNCMTFPEILKVWSEVTGKEAKYVPVSPEIFNWLWGPSGMEMSMQYQSGELWGTDWEMIRPGQVVQPAVIGIEKSHLIDLRGDLQKLKDMLL